MKKSILQILFLLITFSSIWSLGSKDRDEKVIDKKESWQETFPIQDKKPGKYNIVVTAEDQGGNTTTVGPYNLFIDPESDLPVTGVTNPPPEMRVPGNLNIVGTCIDDDAVEYVELVFDGDTENPVRAEGKEFWSYYLDTNELYEGKHLISVTGIDINGVRGHTIDVIWHLDRNQPVTNVTNYGLGELVSGKLTLEGIVEDGNGIKSLEYSLNNGEKYEEVKLQYNKKQNKWTFKISIDTKKLEDGPHVCWFKGLDMQGSTGNSSFLFFVDNTKPEVILYSPKESESINGIFSVAGAAYDVIGIEKLTWQFDKEIGEFELVPGNPYWVKEFDIRGQSAKTHDLTITATDKVGNSSIFKHKLNVDLSADLPIVKLESPNFDSTQKIVPIIDNEFFIRGSVLDDDGVAEVQWAIDNGENHIISTEGVFYENIIEALGEELSYGSHSIKIWATDIHGTVGPVVTVPFFVKGDSPVFNEVLIKTKALSGINYANGIEIHPEAGASLLGSINSASGINSISWKFNGIESGVLNYKESKGNTKYEIPLVNIPWGVVQVEITAEDSYGRRTTENLVIYETNLSKVRGEAKVVFSDSGIDENGIISFSSSKVVSGYFIGDKPTKVEVIPDEGFVRASLNENCISLRTTEKQGKSNSFIVKVTTEKGLSYESEKLQVIVEESAPVMTINQKEVLDGFSNVEISGTATSSYNGLEVGYRILVNKDQIGEFSTLPVDGKGNFSITLPSSTFEEGISIVEFYGKTDVSKETYCAVAVSKVSPLPEANPDDPKAKAPVAAAPLFNWIDAGQVYYTCYYQDSMSLTSVSLGNDLIENGVNGNVFAQAGILPASLFTSGTTSIEVKIQDSKAKLITSKYSVVRPGIGTMRIDSINDNTYFSGMEIELPAPGIKATPSTIRVVIDSTVPVSSVTGKIGSSSTVKAAAKKVISDANSDTEYEAIFVIPELTAELHKIEFSTEIGKENVVSTAGTIAVIRSIPEKGIVDEEKLYWFDSVSQNANGQRVITTNEEVLGYANLRLPITATLKNPNANLQVDVNGNIISVKPLKDGLYENIQVNITDSEGIVFSAPIMSIYSDSSEPLLQIDSPVEQAWLQNLLSLKVTASDSNGILTAEYSLDNGITWVLLPKVDKQKDTYSSNIDLSNQTEGLVSVDVRVTDAVGKQITKRMSLFKDITPPNVEVIIPAVGDVINGETLFALKITDNGKTVEGKYSLPKVTDIELNLNSIVSFMTGTKEIPLEDKMQFVFTDASGNTNTYETKEYIIDAESDKPVLEIHLPEENAIVIKDFVVSGIVHDDDGDSKVWYKIDNGEFVSLEGYGTNYSIEVPLSILTDNEHTITLYAEDMFGIKGDEVTRTVRVSLEEPKGSIISPKFEETVKETIVVSGVTSDKNGIKKVQVSIDNGNSWQDVSGAEQWQFAFDTRLIQDGTHVLFLRVWDNYGVQGLYSSLINIDNTAPEINLELPLDDSYFTTGMVFLSGQTTDNIGLENLYLRIRNMEVSQPKIPNAIAEQQLTVDEIINQGIDVSSLPDGFYNVEITGEDAAGNITRVSRNIRLDTKKAPVDLNLLYPLNGDYVQGNFNIYGSLTSENEVTNVSLIMDGKEIAISQVSPSQYFRFSISPEILTEGDHVYSVRTTLDNGKVIYSEEKYLVYSPSGAWITIDSLAMGDFAVDRPYLEGYAGYTYSEAEVLALKDKATSKYDKQKLLAKAVEKVEISFDNGKTFSEISTKPKWRYRIENTEMQEGYHFLVLRVTLLNGETAVTRTIIQIDKTAPSVKLISPGEGGLYNENIEFSGLSSDDIALKSVTLALRKGDKSSYELPAFIQGLYIDAQFWGATLFNVGAGLTFFDDNVKVQFQFGQFTQEQRNMFEHTPLRYGGNVMGIKLLANLGYVPFSYLFGPDLSWLSATFAIGANFSWFSETQSGKPQILSALLGQIEFPRMTIEKQKVFSTFSLYTECQIWFIPTDVQSAEIDIKSLVPQISLGFRTNVF